MELFRLNLIIGGAILAFSLKTGNDYDYAILVIPVTSFILFTKWIHHALVIRLSDRNFEPSQLKFPELIRRITIFIAILGNFCGMAALALIIYHFVAEKGTTNDHTPLSWLFHLDLVLIAIMLVLFGIWMYLQYNRCFAKKYKARM